MLSAITPQEVAGRLIALPDGRRLHYVEYGLSCGTPVVYCHGMPGSHVEARAAHGAAAELGLRLIAPDRPGYGYSDPAPRVSFVAGASDVLALCDALDLEGPALLGYSGGGGYALAAASLAGARVRRIVLAGAFAPVADKALLQGMGEANLALFSTAPDAQQLARQLAPLAANAGALAAGLIASLCESDRQMLRETALEADVVSNCTMALRQGVGALCHELALLWHPWDFDPAAVSCPVELWHGSDDHNAPIRMSEWLAAHIGDARLHVLANAGHAFVFTQWRTLLTSALAP